MAPSTSLQARIKLFESFESSDIVGHQPIQSSELRSSTAESSLPTPQGQPPLIPFRPSSPPALGRKTSLIDFSEVASPKFKSNSEDWTESITLPVSTSESPTRPHLLLRTAPLPPRKPVSLLEVKPIPLAIPPPLPKRRVSSPVSTALSHPSNNPALSCVSDSHTYPPRSPRHAETPGSQSRDVPRSSTSSFSSDSCEARNSLGGSYETVSSIVPSGAAGSTLHDWEDDFQLTSKMPQRLQSQSQSPLNIDPVSIQSADNTGRPLPSPPPPPRHQQVLVVASPSPQPTSSIHHRPAPLPPKAKKRYDALFERNLPQWQCNGSSGWRVDNLKNREDCDFLDHSSDERRLDGGVIKDIWLCSKLPRARLREIWVECDPNGLGSLDREAFAKGMWRIDEALSHAHRRAPPLASKASNRAPPPPPRKPTHLQHPESLRS